MRMLLRTLLAAWLGVCATLAAAGPPVSAPPAQSYPAPILAQVATRSFFPNFLDTTAGKALMGRSVHRAMDDIVALKLVYSDSYANTANGSTGEVALTGAVTRACGVEVSAKAQPSPASFAAAADTVTTPCTFAGAASETSSAGGNVETDFFPLARPIRRGSFFAVRSYEFGTVGTASSGSSARSVPGEYFGASTTQADLSSGTGNFGSAAAGYNLYPSAIVGLTRNGATLILGDSIDNGIGDSADLNGDFGVMARSIALAGNAYINAAIPSDRASFFIAGHANRAALAKYATSFANGYGTNDRRNGGAPATTILAADATIAGYFPGLPGILRTMTPETTGAWSAADGSDQTAVATTSVITAVNSSRRTTPAAGYVALADVAASVALSSDPTKWVGGYTADGLHPTSAAALKIVSDRAVPVQAVRR